MLPDTVPASHRDVAYPKTGRRVEQDVQALDEHLFNPSPSAWLVIDANNQAVPGVAVSSLRTGLDLIGQGRVAALVGRLRDGAGVVDVDVPGDFGYWVTDEVSRWLRSQGCWVLTRPSGGAEGRSHVFFAHPDYRYAPGAERTGLAAKISDHLTTFADYIRVPRREIDLRDAVRPLSSPHRRGHWTPTSVPACDALASLRRVLPNAPLMQQMRKRPKQILAAAPGTADVRTVIPLEFERWRRALRPQWRTYLLTGRAPDIKPKGVNSTDRSLIEAACTSEMAWAIGDPQTAWRVIQEAHPGAMTKARTQGKAWWIRYVWNKAVEDAQAWSGHAVQPDEADQPDPELVSSILAGRALVDAIQWSLSPRQRPSLHLVAHALLDRMARTRSLRVPCPERDLVLDTGIADRKTIRGVLRLLDGRLGTLHKESFDERVRDSSSFEFELNRASGTGVCEIPPPVFHPPPPPAGLWATLPRNAPQVWRALYTSSSPVQAESLPLLAGLLPHTDSPVSQSLLRSLRSTLRGLQAAGLAAVSAQGLWQATDQEPETGLATAASAHHNGLLAQVEAERLSYRTTAPVEWRSGRERALKENLSRQKRWWNGLGPEERALRAQAKRTEFSQLPLTMQRARKEELARRRELSGISEVDHVKAWANSLPPDEYVRRSRERAAWFASLSPSHQALAVAEWNRFRAAHGIPAHGEPLPEEEVLSAFMGADERDRTFLALAGPQQQAIRLVS